MRVLLALVFIAFIACLAKGQNASETPQPGPPPIQFQVLRSKRVNVGDHLLILNRVVPPFLPPLPPPLPAPTPEDIAKAEAEESIKAQARQKREEVLTFSAGLSDPQVMGVQWTADEHDYRFLTNIDFNLLAGVGTFETPDTVYSLIPGVGWESKEEVEDFHALGTEENSSIANAG